jgi:hypothetical protein
MIWVHAISPRLHRYSWATLIGSALGYTVFACVASAAITCGLLLAIPRRERGDIVWGTLRTSAAGAWFAPAIILLSQLSPAALAAAVVLVMTTTRLLYSEWRVLHPPEEPIPVWVPTDPMFGEADPPRPFFLKALGPALAVALSMQAAVTAFAMHVYLLAGALFVMSTAMLTIFSISAGASDARRPENLPRSILGLVLTIFLAAGLTVGGLRGRVVRALGPGAGMESGTGEQAAGEPGPTEPGATRAGQPSPKDPPQPMSASAADGSYPGVILQPEPAKVPMLVAPVLEMGEGRLYPGARRELTIAFEGEYWMYRFLYRRPPANSYLRKGTPADLSFRTPDHWPLLMEAHQKLDQAIDLECCGKVQVRLWNADTYPGTVSLELLALESGGDGPRSSQSFGIAPVRSVPDLTKEHVTAVMETLEFTVPAKSAPRACNELEVVFRRDRTRMDKSARIAIDRFILVPK